MFYSKFNITWLSSGNNTKHKGYLLSQDMPPRVQLDPYENTNLEKAIYVKLLDNLQVQRIFET
jgi:hypothetical protein